MNEEEMNVGLAQTPGYRYVEKLGKQLFVAGQVPCDSDGLLVGLDDPMHNRTSVLRTWRRC